MARAHDARTRVPKDAHRRAQARETTQEIDSQRHNLMIAGKILQFKALAY